MRRRRPRVGRGAKARKKAVTDTEGDREGPLAEKGNGGHAAKLRDHAVRERQQSTAKAPERPDQLVKSGICAPRTRRRHSRASGFGGSADVVREDTPSLRGMIRKVRHLVEVTKG